MSVRACSCGFVDYTSGVTLQTTLLCYNKLHTRWTQSDINVFLIWYLGMRPTSWYVHIYTQVGRKPKICVGPFVDLKRIAWVTWKIAQTMLVLDVFTACFGRFLTGSKVDFCVVSYVFNNILGFLRRSMIQPFLITYIDQILGAQGPRAKAEAPLSHTLVST